MLIKKPDCNVNSVNPLYLIINRVYGHVSEKNGNKFLTIDKGNGVLKEHNQVFSGIKHHIEKISGNEFDIKFPEVIYDKEYNKIKFSTDDLLPLNRLICFPTLAVVKVKELILIKAKIL